MKVRVRETGAVMYEAQLRQWAKDNNGPTWGQTTEEVLEALGADVVFEGPQAQPTRYQISFADGVEQIQGQWYTKYRVVDLDAEGIALEDAEQAKYVRATRGEKLKESDWTQVADAPVDKAAWAAYRQALRDITAQSEFPWGVIWPAQPE